VKYIDDIKFGRFHVRENEVSLRKRSGGTAQFSRLEGVAIGKRAKLHTVAASNNRDHPTRSLLSSPLVSAINCSLVSQALLEATHQDHSIGINLLLLARATYMWVLCFAHIPFVVNRTFNATPTERLQQREHWPTILCMRCNRSRFTYDQGFRSHVLCRRRSAEMIEGFTERGKNNTQVGLIGDACQVSLSFERVLNVKRSSSPTLITQNQNLISNDFDLSSAAKLQRPPRLSLTGRTSRFFLSVTSDVNDGMSFR